MPKLGRALLASRWAQSRLQAEVSQGVAAAIRRDRTVLCCVSLDRLCLMPLAEHTCQCFTIAAGAEPHEVVVPIGTQRARIILQLGASTAANLGLTVGHDSLGHSLSTLPLNIYETSLMLRSFCLGSTSHQRNGCKVEVGSLQHPLHDLLPLSTSQDISDGSSMNARHVSVVCHIFG